jgi:hypothetical protein
LSSKLLRKVLGVPEEMTVNVDQHSAR